MNLLRGRGWARVMPPPGARVDWGHPLARGLELCVLGNHPQDLVRGGGLNRNGSAFVGHRGDSFGLASATSDFFDTAAIPDTPFLRPTGLSLLWSGRIDSGSAFRHFAGKHATNGATNCPFDFRTDSNSTPRTVLGRASGSTSKGWNSGQLIALNIPTQVGVTVPTNSLADSAQFYYQGKFSDTQTSVASGTVTGSSANLRIGRRADGAVQMAGSTTFVYAWSRVLSLAEYEWLWAEPYAMIAPPAPRVFYLGLDVPSAFGYPAIRSY